MIKSEKICTQDLKVLKESYSITDEVFLLNSLKQTVFMSEHLSKNSQVSALSDQMINYALLVNNQYPTHIYTSFLGRLSKIKNIILEEESNVVINLRVKENPYRCFSRNVLCPVASSDKSTLTNNSVIENSSLLSNLDLSKQETDIDEKELYQRFKMKLTKEIEQKPLKQESEYSEEEISEIIKQKMSKLEDYNSKIELHESKKLVTSYRLDEERLAKLCKLQSFIRRRIYKKKFFEAIRMNEYINHRKNYLRLKKSLEAYEKRQARGSFVSYYSKVSKIFDNLIN